MGKLDEKITINRKTKTAREWLNVCDVSTSTYQRRRRRGWTAYDAMTTPPKIPNQRLITINGETRSCAEWCRIYGTKPCTFYRRLYKGMSEYEALTKSVHKPIPDEDIGLVMELAREGLEIEEIAVKWETTPAAVEEAITQGVQNAA